MAQVIDAHDLSGAAANVEVELATLDTADNDVRKEAIRQSQTKILSDSHLANVLKGATDQFVKHIGASFNATKDTSGIEYQGKTYIPVALAYSMVRNSVYRGLLQTRHPKDTSASKTAKK